MYKFVTLFFVALFFVTTAYGCASVEPTPRQVEGPIAQLDLSIDATNLNIPERANKAITSTENVAL